MNAEFNWWLLIVGLVVGAGLVWVVVMDSRRREVDVVEAERPREALWLSTMLQDEGRDVSPETVERLLTLHRAYLEAPPPDDPASDVAAEADSQFDIDSSPTVPLPLPGPGSSKLAGDDRIGLERGASGRSR